MRMVTRSIPVAALAVCLGAASLGRQGRFRATSSGISAGRPV